MTLNEIRSKYLEFMKEKGHVIVPSASLVPENDPTTLFTGSGMQSMLPFLLGETHPQGTRISDSQKSFRSGDIDDIGDNRHTTFFEMLGNWSFGDYFKREQINWMFDFLVNHLNIDPNRLYVTAFIGDAKNNIPKDTEAGELWKKLFSQKGIDALEVEIGSEANGYEVGMQGGRIFYYDSSKNWWSRAGIPEKMPAGEPGGGDSEMFYEFEEVSHDPKFGKYCHPNCDCGRYIEIGNNVFMEYLKNIDGTFSKLEQRNIDFGGGLERIAMAVANKNDIFTLDVFDSVIAEIEKRTGKSYTDPKYKSSFRIIADHLRSVTFLLSDGVMPGNTDRSYFVRRLLRRAVRHADILAIIPGELATLALIYINFYKDQYKDMFSKSEFIADEIRKEETKFRKTLALGMKELEKIISKTESTVSGEDVFNLFTSFGFPSELTLELAKENGKAIDIEYFKIRLKAHQELSRLGSQQKFKGGLGGDGEIETRYHTATHLLHQALREVLGTHVQQKGSNITTERLRFDFSLAAKMTDEEIQKVEEIVNQKISQALPVNKVVLPKDEAEKTGALHFFGDKYGDLVNVYYIGENLENAYSKEYCGGPHVENTSELGHFKINKEEAVSAGVRRIKATLS